MKTQLEKIREALQPFAAMHPALLEWRFGFRAVPAQEAHPEHVPVIRKTYPCDEQTSYIRNLYVLDFKKAVEAHSNLSKIIDKLDSPQLRAKVAVALFNAFKAQEEYCVDTGMPDKARIDGLFLMEDIARAAIETVLAELDANK